MTDPIRIFVSYSHQDGRYLEKGSLLGFLKGLEGEGVKFWHDGRIATGALWDEAIRDRIAQSHIALVLVSQWFLDSAYCKNVEISGFLARQIPIFPVMLSACDWERHEWLRQRQFLPGGGETIEEHYRNSGRRKRLFREIRTELRARIEALRAPRPRPAAAFPPNPFTQTLAIREAERFVERAAEQRRLLALLEGGSAVILGEPKVGKSSLLWWLARSWEGEVLGPLNFHGVEDREDFYATLAEGLDLAGGGWRAVRRELKRREVLLLLDELDSAPARGLTQDDLGRLRSVCQENHGFKVAAAARSAPKEAFPDLGKGSRVYDFLQPLPLGALTEAEARRLLAHPWAPAAPAFDEIAVAQLLAATDPHPFQLQRAAYHRYEALADPGHDWRRAWRRDLEQML